MKTITILALLTLASCADMTPTQKRWTTIGVSVVAVGAIAAYEADHGHRNDMAVNGGVIGPGQSCTMQPNGTCR